MAKIVIAGQEFNFGEGLGMANMIDMIRAIALLAKQNPSTSISVKDDGTTVGGSLSSLDFKGDGVNVTCDEQGNTVVTIASGTGNGTGAGTGYSHPTGDGNLHCPATGTTSNMKVLVAGPTAGSAEWKKLDLTYLSESAFKQNVVIATTGNLNASFANNKLTNVGTYAQFQQDGATLIAGSRVLVKDQTAAIENGIYEIIDAGSNSTAWVLKRTVDADTASKLSGAFVPVDAGLVNAGLCFTTDFKYTETLNVVPVNWTVVIESRMASNKPAKAAGNAAAGQSIDYARDDHVHPLQTTLAPTESIKPATDGNLSLGTSDARWSTVYANTGVINTSDAREKQQVRELSDAERAVAIRLKSLVRVFKFNNAVEQKGDGARIHVGVIAQDVKSAFEAEGLVAEDYSILCYDEWTTQVDEDGKVVRAAGNRYGVRYEELLAFIISAI